MSIKKILMELCLSVYLTNNNDQIVYYFKNSTYRKYVIKFINCNTLNCSILCILNFDNTSSIIYRICF